MPSATRKFEASVKLLKAALRKNAPLKVFLDARRGRIEDAGDAAPLGFVEGTRQVAGDPGIAVVDVALDGEQALNLFDLHKEEIDIVMLDIGLPKKDGGDVVLKMKEKKQDLKVVVSSGYIDSESKAKMYRAGVRDFIEKPYRPAETVEMLEAVGEKT